MIILFLLILQTAYSQEKDSSKIELTKAPIENTASYAVWRTDFYICAGLPMQKVLVKVQMTL